MLKLGERYTKRGRITVKTVRWGVVPASRKVVKGGRTARVRVHLDTVEAVHEVRRALTAWSYS